MKINYKHMLSLITVVVAGGLALPCVAGPGVYFVAPAPPTVVITVPAPPPPPVVVVPDTYIYDGDEYVGVVGDQYYYLGPGSVWFVMDPVRFHRFEIYENAHPDWRVHMIRNEKYRHEIRDHDRDRDRTEPMHNPPKDDRKDHDFDHHGPPDSH